MILSGLAEIFLVIVPALGNEQTLLLVGAVVAAVAPARRGD